MRWIVLLIGLATVAWASDPPTDTIYARYVITRADSAAYRSREVAKNHRSIVIVCPLHGDTLIAAEVFEGLKAELKAKERRLKRLEQNTADLKAILEQLDSVYTEKDRP